MENSKNDKSEVFVPPGESVVTRESLVFEVFALPGESVVTDRSVVSEVFAPPGGPVVTRESDAHFCSHMRTFIVISMPTFVVMGPLGTLGQWAHWACEANACMCSHMPTFVAILMAAFVLSVLE